MNEHSKCFCSYVAGDTNCDGNPADKRPDYKLPCPNRDACKIGSVFTKNKEWGQLNAEEQMDVEAYIVNSKNKKTETRTREAPAKAEKAASNNSVDDVLAGIDADLSKAIDEVNGSNKVAESKVAEPKAEEPVKGRRGRKPKENKAEVLPEEPPVATEIQNKVEAIEPSSTITIDTTEGFNKALMSSFGVIFNPIVDKLINEIILNTTSLAINRCGTLQIILNNPNHYSERLLVVVNVHGDKDSEEVGLDTGIDHMAVNTKNIGEGQKFILDKINNALNYCDAVKPKESVKEKEAVKINGNGTKKKGKRGRPSKK